MRLILIILFLLTAWLAEAQQYRFHQYQVEQGLPSDLVKAITQDSLGFIWIATDNGLVKYDGLKFTSYKEAFRSQYVKGFFHTRDGRLLAFSDLDLIEIENQIDTVVFRRILRGEHTLTDSTIWYPKTAYQSHDGILWLAEPRSVVRLTPEGKISKRFDFGDENRSPIFVRSFSFFEDHQHNLYTISFQGKVFRHDKTTDGFIEQKDFQLPEEVSQILFHKNKLLIAARNGLYTATVEDHMLGNVTNVFPITGVSNLLLSPDSSIIVSTYGEDLYRVSLFQHEFVWENLYHNFNGINSCFISKEDDIWVATDKGVVLIQKNLFIVADINSQAHFVEGIGYDEKHNVLYYCNKETLVELKPTEEEEWERNVIYENKNSYFRCLQVDKRGLLWAASAAQVLLFEDRKVKRQWDFFSEGNFVHDIFLDSRNNLWLSQSGHSDLKVITESLALQRYKMPVPKGKEVNLVREGPDGLYAVASGSEYLFFKPHGEKEFKNISLPIPFVVQGDFNISDLAVRNGVLWLASTDGLLRYDGKTIARVDLGEIFSNYSVSSVECLDNENILFSTFYGLFRYNINSKEFWLFDENSGLPSNTITNHGILVAKRKDLWIGTSYGLAYAAQSIIGSKPTSKPYCVEARVNGKLQRFVKGVYAPYGSFINLQFSPITFPENKINLQWRMKDDVAWQTLENHQLSLSDLSEGEHTVLVRAKKNTGLGWSEPASFKIIISTPYWKQAGFILLILFLVVFIAWASYAISSRMMNQRKEYLQNLINERTRELQLANEELTLRNTELDRFVYSASHDLSAPLKSILGLIKVARMDEPGDMHVQYLSMMERSVLKLEEFIEEVVSYSRNTRMPIKPESFDFTEFVRGLLQDHQYSPNYSEIEFIIEDELHAPMVSDVTRMKIILNNLISNAIKFHWLDGGRKPYIKIGVAARDNNYIVTVADNGRGIAEKHLQHIFEMFYRATEDSKGSGLGLYILKESVTKLGGTVEAKSKVEEGTSFSIILPKQ